VEKAVKEMKDEKAMGDEEILGMYSTRWEKMVSEYWHNRSTTPVKLDSGPRILLMLE
jgi:hypothetical protein